jgi:hypothetical protein
MEVFAHSHAAIDRTSRRWRQSDAACPREFERHVLERWEALETAAVMSRQAAPDAWLRMTQEPGPGIDITVSSVQT